MISVTSQPPNETLPAQPSIPPPGGTAGWRGDREADRHVLEHARRHGRQQRHPAPPSDRTARCSTFFSRVRHADRQSRFAC